MTTTITSLLNEGSIVWNERQPKKGKINFGPETIEEKIFIEDFSFESEIEFNTISTNTMVFKNVSFKKKVDFIKCKTKSFDFINCTFDGALTFNQCESNHLGLYKSLINTNLSIFESKINRTFELPDTEIGGRLSISKSNIHEIKFNQHLFLNSLHIEGTTIEDHINCLRSIFKSDFKISNSKINGYVNFRGTIFENRCHFDNVEIEKDTIFNNSKFYGVVNFFDVKFFGNATFSGSQFSTNNIPDNNEENYHIDFSNSVFYKNAYFISESTPPNYYKTPHEKHEKAIEEIKLKNLDLDKEKIASTNFSGVKFRGKTSFQGRKFIGQTNFGPSIKDNKDILTEFSFAPNFHECEFHQNTTFHKAIFPEATGSDEAARAYRTLKLAFSKKYDLRQEQNFYKLEMLEELKSEDFFKNFIPYLFNLLSDFGFSIKKPLILILLSTIPSIFAYGFLADLEFCNPFSNECDMFGKLFQFTLFAIPGFEKISLDTIEPLFEEKNFNGWVIAVLFLHKVIMLLGLFLLGLALRNLFKMK